MFDSFSLKRLGPFAEGLIDVLFPVAAGLFAGLMAALIAGESPLHVASVMVHAAFGSPYDIGMTLVYTTPLVFTGLSVAVAYRAGLFNIGAEGQLVIGGLTAAAAGILAGEWFSEASYLGSVLAQILVAAAASTSGAFLGGFTGFLKARRGSHEVVTSIMCNFLVTAFCSWVVIEKLRSMDTQNPETMPVGPAFRAMTIAGFGEAPVTLWFAWSLVAALIVWLLFNRTLWGFQLLATGANPDAARHGGIDTGREMIRAMAIAGALAGLGGLGDVLGGAGRFRLGFSHDYGFTGIAVALLGRGTPLGVVASAFLFGALHKGALDLDFETDHVTRDLATVMQGLVILFAASRFFRWRNSSK
jgi:ABC-type uncharacterized transport system permease subunit